MLDTPLGLIGYLIVSAIVVGIARAIADAGSAIILGPVLLASRNREEPPGWTLPVFIVWRVIVVYLVVAIAVVGAADWAAYYTRTNVWVIRIAGLFVAFASAGIEPGGDDKSALVGLVGIGAALVIYVLSILGLLPHLHVGGGVYFGW